MKLAELPQPEGSAAREWAVSGEDGAVSFLVFPREKTEDHQVACVFGIHSARRGEGLKRHECDVLDQGWCYEDSRFDGAHRLWLMSGSGANSELIGEVLRGLYNTVFGKGRR